MKDAATNVLVRQKSTSLSELFSFELKLTIGTLVKWFNFTFKLKFLELGEIQKQIFSKKNPIDFSKTRCCISGFKLFTSAKEAHKKVQNLATWYDFTVQQEYLLIRDNYEYEDLFPNGKSKVTKNHYEAFSSFLEVVVLLDKCCNRTISSSNVDDIETLKKVFNEHLVDYDDFSEVDGAIDDFTIIEKYKTFYIY